MNKKEVPQTNNEMHDLIKAFAEENRPYGGWEGQWAGDGSGMDDFADYNQNEGWGNW